MLVFAVVLGAFPSTAAAQPTLRSPSHAMLVELCPTFESNPGSAIDECLVHVRDRMASATAPRTQAALLLVASEANGRVGHIDGATRLARLSMALDARPATRRWLADLASASTAGACADFGSLAAMLADSTEVLCRPSLDPHFAGDERGRPTVYRDRAGAIRVAVEHSGHFRACTSDYARSEHVMMTSCSLVRGSSGEPSLILETTNGSYGSAISNELATAQIWNATSGELLLEVTTRWMDRQVDREAGVGSEDTFERTVAFDGDVLVLGAVQSSSRPRRFCMPVPAAAEVFEVWGTLLGACLPATRLRLVDGVFVR